MAVAILEFASGARGVIEGSTCCWSIRSRLMRGSQATLGANDPKAIQPSSTNGISRKSSSPPSARAAEARKSVALTEATYQSAADGGAKIRL